MLDLSEISMGEGRVRKRKGYGRGRARKRKEYGSGKSTEVERARKRRGYAV